MKRFNDETFMLNNDTAVRLYNDHASIRKVPIIDYHCHIPVEEIRFNKRFRNITEIWLGADHYKWRQMRVCGINERYITGDASDYEKFEAFASIMPKLMGNPLYHWSHLELAYYFDIHEPLSLKSARNIYDRANTIVERPDFNARSMIKASNVALLCTTDDPADTLEHHVALAKDDTFDTKVLPAFRPDNALDIEKASWKSYIAKLGDAAGIDINGADDLKAALRSRMDHFERCGCRISDHGLYDVRYMPCDNVAADRICREALAGGTLSDEDVTAFKTWLLEFLAGEYEKKNWVMQLHYGVTRSINTKALEALGVNTGFDVMHNDTRATGLIAFLDALEQKGNLPKTILYSLNPNDNAVIDCIIGAFAEEGIRGKLQHGSAWWFNDHLDGMTEQIKSYAALSTLGNHIGMLTDSRSFLSYTRHDYFRRILCNIVGEWVELGMYPDDEDELAEIIKDISLNNAVRYFGFDI